MKEIDDEVISKEINNLDKLDSTVDTVIKNMGAIWKSCGDKLKDDNTCFICKKPLEEGFGIVKVPDEKIEKGLFAMVSICKKCKSDS